MKLHINPDLKNCVANNIFMNLQMIILEGKMSEKFAKHRADMSLTSLMFSQ